MLTPNTNTQPQLFPATDSELSHSYEYYQHKANECRDLVDDLLQWEMVPGSQLEVTVGGLRTASFKIGPAENVVLQTVLMGLMVYYQRKAQELRGKLEGVAVTNDISQGSSLTGNADLS